MSEREKTSLETEVYAFKGVSFNNESILDVRSTCQNRDTLSFALLHYHPPPPPNQRTPSQIDPAPNGNGLGHYTKSYINYMPSKLGFIMVDIKITLSATNYMQKCPRNSSEN